MSTRVDGVAGTADVQSQSPQPHAQVHENNRLALMADAADESTTA